MRTWPARRWAVAVVAATATLVVIGVPTGIIRTSWYTRMTPVTWWDYPIWLASGLLTGLVAATYVRAAAGSAHSVGRVASGGLLSAFAVGCPICNKLVVAVMGISGALKIWAPVQPLLGVLSVALLSFALVTRLRGEVSCPLPVTA